MDELKGKFKDFMKKVNSQSSSSTSFRGQGRVLGNAQTTSSEPVNRPQQKTRTQPPAAPRNTDKEEPNRIPKEAPANPGRFDPFDSLITSSKTSKNGYSLNLFQCPICGSAFGTEEDVSFHVDSCADNDNSSHDRQLHDCVAVFLSGNPSDSSIEIVVKLLRNVAKEPDNAKFRRIRMGNPKIKEAIADPTGGIALIRFLGFDLKDEDGETWAVMENPPSDKQVTSINAVVNLLDLNKVKENKEDKSTIPLPQKIDRQIRVFFPVSESVASRIELPDSFYTLSADEVRREADARKKKIADSQLLIPKSAREKQARKKYLRSIIRIQFPDGVVLQGVFGSQEPTTALHEFVSSAMKNPSLEFELLDPVTVNRRVIPMSGKLEDNGLVPSALIKFKPMDCESSPYMGISDELLQIMEPIT